MSSLKNIRDIAEGNAEPEQIDLEELTNKHERETSLPVDRSTKKIKKAVSVPKVDQGRSATGKRSNPDFEKVGVYIRKDTRRSAIRKYEDEGGSELSDLMEALLTQYINK